MEVSEIKQRAQKKVKVQVNSVRTYTQLGDLQIALNRIFNYIGFFFKFKMTPFTRIIENSLFGVKTISSAESVKNQIYNNAHLELIFTNADLRIEFSKSFNLKIQVNSVSKAPFNDLLPEFVAIEFLNSNILLIENGKDFKLIEIDRFQILKRYVLLSHYHLKMVKKPLEDQDMNHISSFYVRNKFFANQVQINLPYFFKPVITAIKQMTEFSMQMVKKISENIKRNSINRFIIDNRAESVITVKSLTLYLNHQPVNVNLLEMPS